MEQTVGNILYKNDKVILFSIIPYVFTRVVLGCVGQNVGNFSLGKFVH